MKQTVVSGIVAGILVVLLSATSAFAMQVFVTAPNGRIITVDVEPSDSIGDLKALIETSAGIPISEQILRYMGVDLDDGRTLSDYNIQRRSTVQLSVPAPAWTDSTLAEAVVGVGYTDGVSTDTVSDFVLASGQLPPGLSLAATGELTGTPTAPGTYTFVIGARAAFTSADLPVTLVVAAAPSGTPLPATGADVPPSAGGDAPAHSTAEVRLAPTGLDANPSALIALLLLALGGAAAAARSRRTQA